MLDLGWRSGLAFLSLALAVACAGTRPYVSDAAENVAVRTEVESGVSAMLHVYRVDATCHAEYRGSIPLDRHRIGLGLPEGASAFLEISFETSSFFGGTSIWRAGSLLKPRAGHGYELVVSYRDDLYNLILLETNPRGGPSREVPRRGLVRCAE
jgi:hypothetical protein